VLASNNPEDNMAKLHRDFEKVKALRKFNDKEKWCPKCKKWLSLEDFHKNRGNPSGRQNTCIKCNETTNGEICGVSAVYWEEQLKLQDNKCAICNKPLVNLGKRAPHEDRPERDHCHITLLPRGVLCGRCNRLLGRIGESVEILKNAIRYIEKYENNYLGKYALSSILSSK